MVHEIDLICFEETCIFNDTMSNTCRHGQPSVEIECDRVCRCITFEERDEDEDDF